MDSRVFNFIFRDKPARALLAIFENQPNAYATGIAKDIDCTYPHIVKILAAFKEQKLIAVSESGRVKILKLTSKGQKIALKLREIAALCNEQ